MDPVQSVLTVDEPNSRHMIQVLRMKPGATLNLTDGKGNLFQGSVEDDNKKKCTVRVLRRTIGERSKRDITIAISLVKNASRFEWFLEKVTEIGIRKIIPLICERTERQKFRLDRMQGILVSALLQSQQTWLPELVEPLSFVDAVEQVNGAEKLIAHCLEPEKQLLLSVSTPTASEKIILIGPEGDFSQSEIDHAISKGFIPVSLGATRLRTETAGMVAATLLQLA